VLRESAKGGGGLGYLMLVGLQGVIVTDEEEAHGSHQELKQLHQGGVTPIWPHLHPSTKQLTTLLSVSTQDMTSLRLCRHILVWYKSCAHAYQTRQETKNDQEKRENKIEKGEVHAGR